MEEVAAVSGKPADGGGAAGAGCNYQAPSSEDVDDAAVSSADQQSPDMIQNHLHHSHPYLSEHGRVLPPQYDSLSSLNNNNSYSADSVNGDAKYHQLTAHLFGQGHPYHHHHHHHHRYQLDNLHHHHQQQQQQQQLAQYQLDYCNAVPAGQSYDMTSSSSAISVSRAPGYCARGQFDLAAVAAAAYSAGETRSSAGYWTPSCGVDTDQQPADLDEHVDVKPTLLDPSSYLLPAGHYPSRHQGYLPGWYQATGYGWGMAGGCSAGTGGYYTGNSGYNDLVTQSTSPPMHHILRGVYNTLQVIYSVQQQESPAAARVTRDSNACMNDRE